MLDDRNRDDAERKKLEQVMKALGLELNWEKLADDGPEKFEFKKINPALTTVTPDAKPERDITINKDDIDNLTIEMGLYETGKITFDEFLERV